MPQLQPVVLTDRSTPTPVDTTFVPQDIVGNVGTVSESSGVPIGDNRLAISMTRTAQGRRKPKLQFTFPTLVTETINGVDTPRIVRTAYADLTFTFDESSTEQERKNVVGMVQSALQADKVLINDVVVKLQAVY